MSSGQQRGRGRGGPRGDSPSRGAPRGGSRGDRSERGQSRDDRDDRTSYRGDRSDRGAFRGDRGDRGAFRGDRRGSRGDRGGRPYDRGGFPRGGQSAQLPFRGPSDRGTPGVYLDGVQPAPPERSVREKEDALLAETRGKEIDGFPGRQSYGSNGRAILLRTNYLSLTTAYEVNRPQSEQTFYRYTIDVQPEPSRPKRAQLIAQLVNERVFEGVTWATDYARLIVTTKKLDLGDKASLSLKILIRSPNTNANASDQSTDQGQAPDFVLQARQRNTVDVTINYTSSYRLRDLVQFLQSTSPGAHYPGTGDLIQMLNIIVCKPPTESATVANVGQNKFYPFLGNPLAQSYDLGAGLQALRGFYSSVRPTVGRLLLNLNTTSGAFYEAIPVVELMQKYGGRDNEQVESFLHMLKVEASYVKDKQQKPFMTKIKTIVGFAKELSPRTFRVQRFGNARDVKFSFIDKSIPNAEPQETSVYDYFFRQHGITLRYPNYPVLNTGTRKDPQYMPPELCTVVAGQPFRRLLQPDQTSEMIKFAARFPNLNAMSIAGTSTSPGVGLQLFNLADATNQGNPQTTSVEPFGFRIGTSLITVPGRVLDSPKVVYAANKVARVNRGSWNLQGLKFLRGGAFKAWKAMVISHSGPRGSPWQAFSQENPSAESLFDRLSRELNDYGIRMGRRLQTHNLALDALNDGNRQSNNRKLSEAFQTARAEGAEILFVILPAQDRWLYARIKFYGDTQFGIHTINAIGRNFQKPQGIGMFIGNLALKFNVKGGGVSHNIPLTLMQPVGNNTMLFGIDVTHPSPGSSKGAPSIACVVANTDENLFQWPGSIRTQTGRVEMVEGLKDMVLERLRLWQKRHRSLPDKIVIYRDGVSEGQFQLVLQTELPAFEEAYQTLYGAPAKWPKTAIIIVGKRHHTRFYPTRQEDADVNNNTGKGSWNTQPGTVVDRGITGRIIHEFYLQAHSGLQGTVRPAHYSVIKDDVGFNADQLERLTLNLCYYFVRCTKAVSICPPAYYADLLAERGRAYLFSTLQENHGSESSVFDGATSEWRSGVHPAIAESTWYI